MSLNVFCCCGIFHFSFDLTSSEYFPCYVSHFLRWLLVGTGRNVEQRESVLMSRSTLLRVSGSCLYV